MQMNGRHFCAEKKSHESKITALKRLTIRKPRCDRTQGYKTPDRSTHDRNACRTYRNICSNCRGRNNFALVYNRVNEIGEDVEQLPLLELEILDVRFLMSTDREWMASEFFCGKPNDSK